MKWLLLFCVVVALLYSVVADDVDYTGRYAELAAPVPSHVNVDELLLNLRSASNLP